MLAAVAALASLGCMALSARRLALAVSPTAYDPDLLLRALSDRGQLHRLRDRLAQTTGDVWERDLVDAACAPDLQARAALIDEQLLEADWATERWSRVPRVCASVATSVGFLCAALWLIGALGSEAPTPADPASGATLTVALDALTLGLVGTTFCAAVHLRTRAVTRRRRAAVDQLVDRLRALSSS